MKQNGITLIALVLTIIVLLILAGVSFNLIVGENGVLSKAQNAALQQQVAKGKEDFSMDLLSYTTEKITQKTSLEEWLLANKKDYTKKDDGTFDVVYNNFTYTVSENPVLEITDWEAVLKDTTPGKLDGAGTEEDPYVINSIEDYVAFVLSTWEDERYYGEYIVIARNLDFKDKLSYVDTKTKEFGDLNKNGKVEELYDEINSREAKGLKNADKFGGTLDGRNHVINNFYMKDNLNESDNKIGLFERNVGIIKNLTVSGEIEVLLSEDDEIQNVRIASLVANNTSGGQIINVRTDIDIKVTGVINQLFTTAKVYIGGIVGENELNDTAEGPETQINRCINSGKIYCDVDVKVTTTFEGIESSYNSIKVGGIVGKNVAEVLNCINEGDIYCSKDFYTNLPEAEDNEMVVGGITSETEPGTRTENVINLGNIEGVSETSEIDIGGILGETEIIDDNIPILKNAYSAGNVKVSIPDTQELCLGGIVGDGNEGIIDNVYSIANISYPLTLQRTECIGAVIGNCAEDALENYTNCYYKKGKILGAEGSDQNGTFQPIENLGQSTVIRKLNEAASSNTEWLEFVEMAGTVRFK